MMKIWISDGHHDVCTARSHKDAKAEITQVIINRFNKDTGVLGGHGSCRVHDDHDEVRQQLQYICTVIAARCVVVRTTECS